MPWPYLSSRNKSAASRNSGVPLSSSSDTHNADDHEGGGDDEINNARSSMVRISLGDAGESYEGRRAASLDVSRPQLNTLTPLNTAAVEKPKARRSSFPRLALPSWRQAPSPSTPSAGYSSSSKGKGSIITSSSSSKSRHSSRRQSLALDDNAREEDEGVELQEGHGTPYTATGLKGGFQCTSPQPSTLSGSSSIASTSSSSRRSGSSYLFSLLSGASSASRTTSSSDEYSLDQHESSLSPSNAFGGDHACDEAAVQRQSSSNGLKEPIDSGFSEFGPHSIVAEEEERRRSSLSFCSHRDYPARHTYQVSASSSASISERDEDRDDETGRPASRDGGSNVPIPKKARSRGWFSFNTSSLSSGAKNDAASEDTSSTPKNERHSPQASSAVSVAETDGHDGTAVQQPTTVPPVASSDTAKKNKSQSASAKGISMIRNAGRKRGDSEVSMKEMTSFS